MSYQQSFILKIKS